MVRITQAEHRLARGDRVDDPRATAGHDEIAGADAFLFEELLLARDEVLAVHERGDAVRDGDRLPLREREPRNAGDRSAGRKCAKEMTTSQGHRVKILLGPAAPVESNTLTGKGKFDYHPLMNPVAGPRCSLP